VALSITSPRAVSAVEQLLEQARRLPPRERQQLDGDLTMPRGKIVARPPLDRALQEVLVNGKATRNFTADEVVIDELPADVVMR